MLDADWLTICMLWLSEAGTDCHRDCYRTKSVRKSSMAAGASILPEAMMHSPCFRFPPVFEKNFRFCGKFSQFYLFPKIFCLIIDHKFRIFSPIFEFLLYFLSFSTFPPSFAKIINSLLFKFPPSFPKIHVYFTCFTCISFPPYFDHDAFMHHTMHVLDASGIASRCVCVCKGFCAGHDTA